MARRLARIAAGLLLAVVGCRGAAAEIVIAVAAPLSGPHQATGEAVRAGAERAVRALNDAGGLRGERVGLLVEDDGCESVKAAATAKAIVEKGAAFVVGHPCSGAAIAAAPVYAAGNVVLIAPGVRHPALTESRAGGAVFRLAGRDDRQGEAAAQWLARMAPNGRIALLHDRTRYARALAEDTARRLKAAGVAPLPMLSIVAGRQDYSAITRRLRDGSADVLFIAGYPSEARLIVDDLKRAGLGTRVLGTDSLATLEFADVAAANGERLRVLLARDPEIGALAQAAVEAWADGVRQANSFRPEDVSAALARNGAQTNALGPISFDEKGDARIVSFGPAVWSGTSWEPRD
jgi:branched-chain amino acid transport system substrate-binding protein